MDDIINRGILYGTHPPKGIYFTVSVEYNPTHPIFDGKIKRGEGLTSSPIKTFPEAMTASEHLVGQLQAEKFEGSLVVEVDPSEHDGFHYMLNDATQVPIARVGINTHDYRTVTVH
jgi:hypothetical protein